MDSTATAQGKRHRALFVANRNALSEEIGGVQVYTRELLQTLGLAGFDLSIVQYEPDQRFVTKLRRRIRPRPYENVIPPDLAGQVAAELQKTGAEFIFLNGVDLAGLAKSLRNLGLQGKARIVLFSYGLRSVDYLHTARMRGDLGNSSALTLGRHLFAEMESRQIFDAVFCLAEFEAEIERWLGARQVDWLPRTIPQSEALDWQPQPDRVGCVSTVDHWPNREGIILFMEQFQKIAPPHVRVRLVGSPQAHGEELARRFPALDFLGRLDESALRKEAATWSCFVHPLFFYACGSSTKLAVALGWQIPVVTTSAGRRGYVWREGSIPIAESPGELTRLALQHLEPETARAARDQIRGVVGSSPSLADVAAKLRRTLDLLNSR